MNLDTPPIRRIARRAGRVAPFLSLALLIASPAVLARDVTTADDLKRLETIAASLQLVPLRIGSWVGVDVPVPTEATEILNANALLSREYTKIGGRDEASRVVMALIHCRDVRDMNGHWPLNCYPQSGWSVAGSTPEVAVPIDGTPSEFTWVRFTRPDRNGMTRTMSVLFAFVLPDGRIETSMSELGARAERRGDSAKGVAQFQFVFNADVPPDEAAKVAAELLRGVPESLLRQLGVRPPDPQRSSALGVGPSVGEADGVAVEDVGDGRPVARNEKETGDA
jgi:hypothetical protein